MSAENKQLIEGLYAAFGRGDVPAIIGALDAEIEWWEAENFIYADKNPYRGPQTVLMGVFGRIMADWDGFTVTPEEVLDAGDTVVGRGYYAGKYRKTGRAVKAQFAHVFKIRDGKVVKFQQYTDTAQFREAVAASV
ncbi:MAG TPA: nuclear transport factor 2 family protein [Pyrinomonadaceae bacterium]|nr:nuclear transport factor 2 family protein [Pyrinomonadaceae bacterium]